MMGGMVKSNKIGQSAAKPLKLRGRSRDYLEREYIYYIYIIFGKSGVFYTDL